MTDGIVLTAQEVAQSDENKQKKTRTIAQLPVFRNGVTLLGFVVDLAARTPRNTRRFTDSSIDIANSLLKTIGLANENRGEERILYITDAVVCTFTLKAHLGLYYGRGLMSKDVHNKAKKICDNTVAQLYGWRDSTLRSGHVS
ncbi:MAG: hypothetical protein MJZ30_07530 [Paludibacteraceae bacterium]|nr:hypothetical protein [Paludibacteraceae bacterium]